MLKTCEDCERPSNNKFFNCPPRMDDGRHFTDYRPRCTQQYQDKVKNNIMSSYDYRMFLTRNADSFIKHNALNAYMQNRCGPCMEPYNVGTMLPEIEKQTCNERTCSFAVNDPYGIGLGRKFFTQDMENAFEQRFLDEKQKEQTYFKQGSQCCGTIKDEMQYYPIDGTAPLMERNAVPSGGTPLTGGDLLL